MQLDTKKRLAAQILKCSKNRIWFDVDRLEDIKEAITKADIRSLIADKAVKEKPVKGVSRTRARKTALQKRKGRRKGIGSRKGKKTARKTFLKYLTSRIGNILTTNISGVKIHDFTNGYRAIRKEVVNQMGYPDSAGNAFLMEFIVKAHKKRFRITEIPATFKDRVAGKSKLKLGRQAGIYFLKLIKYRFS